MVLTGTTVLRNMCFSLDFNEDYSIRGFDVNPEDERAFNKIVAKDSLRISSVSADDHETVIIQKKFITGFDVAEALVECERVLRERTYPDPDHSFFEGFVSLRAGSEEVVCMRWGS